MYAQWIRTATHRYEGRWKGKARRARMRSYDGGPWGLNGSVARPYKIYS